MTGVVWGFRVPRAVVPTRVGFSACSAHTLDPRATCESDASARRQLSSSPVDQHHTASLARPPAALSSPQSVSPLTARWPAAKKPCAVRPHLSLSLPSASHAPPNPPLPCPCPTPETHLYVLSFLRAHSLPKTAAALIKELDKQPWTAGELTLSGKEADEALAREELTGVELVGLVRARLEMRKEK